MKISGIYKIESLSQPTRCYIGSTIDIHKRIIGHFNRLKNNEHHSVKLQRHYNKYGLEDLKYSIICLCDKENLIKNEQYFIDLLNPYFNVCMVAGNTLGRILSQRTKNKIGASNKGKKRSLEVKKILSIKRSGRKPNLGHIHSVETKNKMKIAHHKTKHYLSGLHLPLETKMKISLSHKGKTISEETRNKMKESHIGLKHTEESKLKMSQIKKAINSLKLKNINVA